jgi:dTDP-4-dehydrorhamnose 3,5-epimerase
VEVTKTELIEVVLLTPRIWTDRRGFFLESFNAREYERTGIPTHFVQDNHSRSTYGVLRGLHYQLAKPQGKLVTVIRGRIFDVTADVRRGSPTFGQCVSVVLDDVRRQSLWIPPGFAHGFCALSEEVDVLYKCTEYYDPPSERGICWNDPTLSIPWPIESPILSEKDASYPQLSTEGKSLPHYIIGR